MAEGSEPTGDGFEVYAARGSFREELIPAWIESLRSFAEDVEGALKAPELKDDIQLLGWLQHHFGLMATMAAANLTTVHTARTDEIQRRAGNN
jgi:hypothetical protein